MDTGRRSFFKRGLELVIAAHCLPLLDEHAMAMQPRPGTKPPLTEASLNAIIPTANAEQRVFIGQMFPDMKAFIRARFTLSPEQDRALTTMSSASIERIQKAVEAAVIKGAKISVTAVGTNAAPELDLQVAPSGDVRIDAGGCIRLAVR
jgi:hypothetical protein